MIVLSVGLPKSASTLLFRYTVDLVAAARPENGQEALHKLVAAGVIPGAGGFVRAMTPGTRDLLVETAREHGPVVVKQHTTLTPVIRQMIREGDAVATYIHRDPRDIILSAIDHGRRAGKRGAYFRKFTSVEASLPMVSSMCRGAIEWVESGVALVLRYDEIVAAPRETLGRMVKHLELDVDSGEVDRIMEMRERARRPGVANFNKGKLRRFDEEMSHDDLALCNRALGAYLPKLGYST